MRLIYVLLVAVLFITSCHDENIETTHIRINHYKQTAVGISPTLALLVQEGEMIGTNDWQYHYSEISGFEYEWGYIYDLKIHKRTIENPPADASSIEFILEEVISKNPVEETETFEIRLKSLEKGIIPSVLTGDVNSGFEIFTDQEINCSNLCQEMTSYIEMEDELTGVFTHESGKIRLTQLILK